MNLLRTIAYEGIALALLLNCSAALSQPGVGQATAPATVGPSKMPATSTKRVSEWFATYDQIRRDAQMTPSEKSNAHKLMTAALSGNNSDKTDARKMLTTMSARYEKAIAGLNRLPQVPETSKLHQGYLRYFKTGNTFFRQYLTTLSHSISPNAIQGLDSARKQMGLLDVSNKLVDKKLRKQYNIAPFHA